MAYFNAFSSVYDEYTQNVNYAERAGYIAELLQKSGVSDGILLDAACGTGSLSLQLCRLGFDIIAVDNSPDMLMVAREKLSAVLDKALLLCQDITQLDLYGTVDCVVCSLDSVNHLLTPEEVLAAFKSIGVFTRSGGVFVFDVNTLYKHRNLLSDNTFVFENDSSFLVWRNSECDDNDVVNIILDIFIEDENGCYKRCCEDFSERAYDTALLSELLEKAGFSVEKICGDMSFSAPKEQEERIYFVAKKL